MNPHTGEIVEVPEGEKPPSGFTFPLTHERATELRKKTPGERVAYAKRVERNRRKRKARRKARRKK